MISSIKMLRHDSITKMCGLDDWWSIYGLPTYYCPNLVPLVAIFNDGAISRLASITTFLLFWSLLHRTLRCQQTHICLDSATIPNRPGTNDCYKSSSLTTTQFPFRIRSCNRLWNRSWFAYSRRNVHFLVHLIMKLFILDLRVFIWQYCIIEISENCNGCEYTAAFHYYQ